MTVESSKNKAGPFLVTGTSGTFPRDFLLIDEDHLRVIRVRGEVETDLTVGISHTGIGTPDGTVTITAGIEAGDQVYLLRSVPKLQRSDYSAQGRVRADQVESDFDILAMQVQDLSEVQGRGLTVPISSKAAGEDVIRAALDAPRQAERAEKAADAAEAVVGGIAYLEDLVTQSEGARDKSQEWADKAVDAPVEPGKFSALHHAAKSESAQISAETAEAGANAARLAAEAARDAATVNAQVYADTAAGIAATTEGDQFQVVAGDEIIRYRHDAGPVATEVARYPTAEKVDAIPAVADKLSADAEVLVDDAGAILRRTDAAGRVFVPGMDGRSVQQQAAEDREAIHQGSGFRRRDVFQIEDDTGRVTLRQDEDGGVYIPGLPGSIQAALGHSVGEVPRFPANPRDQLHDLIRPLTQNLVVQGLPYIDPPTMLVPNRYGVPDSFVAAFTLPPPDLARGLWLETPHGPGGLVHPYLLEMRKPLNGYRYLFGDTPHLSGASEENPCLWGTNDLRNFTLWPGIRNPLGQPPLGGGTWNADIGFAYDPRNGELICYWIGTDTSAAPHLHYRSTWDGVNWTPEMWVPDHAAGGTLSPAILYDPARDVWHMWAVVTEGSVTHWTGPAYHGPWTQQSVVNFGTTFGIRAWHIEVKYLGDKFVMLANRRNDGCNLWLGVSPDGDTWTFGPGLFQPQGPEVYKSTFLPQWDGNNLRLMIAWNAYTFPRKPGVIQYLYIEPTNWVDTTTLS